MRADEFGVALLFAATQARRPLAAGGLTGVVGAACLRIRWSNMQSAPLALAVALALILSACGSHPTPTPVPTALADYTVVAKTKYGTGPWVVPDRTGRGSAVTVTDSGAGKKQGTYVTIIIAGAEHETLVTVECFDATRVGAVLSVGCR